MPQDISCNWEESGLIRAQAHDLLTPRLSVNEKCQQKDFQVWLQSKLGVSPGEKVLDIACGEGVQTLNFLKRIGPRGFVVATDINQDSLDALNSKTINYSNLNVIKADMMDYEKYTSDLSNASEGHQLNFSLINCAFALPYASSPLDLVSAVSKRLDVGGRIAVSLPVQPHGMVEFCSSFHGIPESVLNSISFGENFLIKHMRRVFAEVDVCFFNDIITFRDVNDFRLIYENSTYFDSSCADDVIAAAEKLIASSPEGLSFPKGSILLIGRDPLVVS